MKAQALEQVLVLSEQVWEQAAEAGFALHTKPGELGKAIDKRLPVAAMITTKSRVNVRLENMFLR